MNARIITSIAAAGLTLAAFAQELPQISPLATVEQTIGLTKVKVTYSRPSAKGRAIFGNVVPFKTLWRTGANKATRFETDGPLEMGGQQLPAGTYALFTIPEQDAWQIIFNKNADQAGTGDFKESDVVLTVKVVPAEGPMTETFTIDFADLGMDAATLELRWEKMVVRVPISADSRTKAMASINTALEGNTMTFGDYNRIARYCLDRGERTKDALGWAQRSVEMERHYWNTYTLALAQAANGDRAGAVKTAEVALELAKGGEGDAGAQYQIQRSINEWSGK